ncbi:MAG: peptidoglycan-associated lipoprotein Pal [Terriglobales bacterium]
MNHKNFHALTLVVTLAVVLLSAGCAKKAAKATPPAPPAPATPTATLAANPAVIQQGQATTLTWQTSNAAQVTIAGLGALPPTGSRSVLPGTSTTYTLVAQGPGGTKDASARVTVNEKMAAATSSLSDEELFARNVKDVFFDYNVSNIRPNETPITQQDASFLARHPNLKVLIEGHCDDRGSVEYNLALGTSRAETVKQTLLQQGITADRIKSISYGKEKPFCTQDNEQCWQQNRVDHFDLER